MTEKEWEACKEPQKMLEALGASGKATERKLTLFAAACCRRVSSLLDKRNLNLVEVVEQFVDGKADKRELVAGLAAGDPSVSELGAMAAVHCLGMKTRDKLWQAQNVAFTIVLAVCWDERQGPDVEEVEMAYQAALLRDTFGSLRFREVALDPAWLTGTVRGLGEAAYEDRELPAGHLDPARLAVLADTLEDAGCTDALLLDHLRAASPHVRGCFAVDAVLGRS